MRKVAGVRPRRFSEDAVSITPPVSGRPASASWQGQIGRIKRDVGRQGDSHRHGAATCVQGAVIALRIIEEIDGFDQVVETSRIEGELWLCRPITVVSVACASRQQACLVPARPASIPERDGANGTMARRQGRGSGKTRIRAGRAQFPAAKVAASAGHAASKPAVPTQTITRRAAPRKSRAWWEP